MLELLCKLLLSMSVTQGEDAKFLALDFAIQTNDRQMFYDMFRHLKDRPTRARCIAMVVQRLDTAKPDVQYVMIDELAWCVGPDAKDAIPTLVKIVNSREVQYEKVWVPARIAKFSDGEKVHIPAHEETNAIRTPNRKHAIFCLGRIGTAAKVALPALAESLDVDDADIRFEACAAIHRIAPGTHDVRKRVVAGLRSDSPRDRLAAFRVLLDVQGQLAADLWPEVVRMMDNPETEPSRFYHLFTGVIPPGRRKEALAVARRSLNRLDQLEAKQLNAAREKGENMLSRENSFHFSMMRNDRRLIRSVIDELEASLQRDPEPDNSDS